MRYFSRIVLDSLIPFEFPMFIIESSITVICYYKVITIILIFKTIYQKYCLVCWCHDGILKQKHTLS
jgi:hypothetical protein